MHPQRLPWLTCCDIFVLACNAGEDRKGRGEGCNKKEVFENIKIVAFALFPGTFRPAGKGSFFFPHFSPAVPAHAAAQTRATRSSLLSTPFSCCTLLGLSGLFLKMLSIM